MGAFMARQAAQLPQRFDTVIPVPLHRERLIARGYDQAGWLARAVARRLGLPCLLDRLERTRATLPQAGLGKNERHDNAAGAFAARRPLPVRTRVLLVDDVVTTGATIQAAAAALAATGIEGICGLVLLKVAPH